MSQQKSKASQCKSTLLQFTACVVPYFFIHCDIDSQYGVILEGTADKTVTTVIAFVVIYQLWYARGYQEFAEVEASVTKKVKGFSM